MRVLAVAQGLHPRAAERRVRWKAFAGHVAHPGRDRRVVGGGARIGLGGEPASEGERRLSVVGVQVGEHRIHVVAVDAHGDEGVVLGRRADHRGPANIDVAPGLLHCYIRFRNGLLEGIQIHHHHVDGHSAGSFEIILVGIVVGLGKKPEVNLEIQRFHEPPLGFWLPRIIGNPVQMPAGCVTQDLLQPGKCPSGGKYF